MPLRTAAQLGEKFFAPVFLSRVFFVLLSTYCGLLLGDAERPYIQVPGISEPVPQPFIYSAIAFLIAVALVVIEFATAAVSSHKILMAGMGAFAGLVFAHFFARTIPPSLARPESTIIVCNLFFGYFGIIVAVRHADRFRLSRLKFLLGGGEQERPQILDSSVIIDGRIREMVELGSVRGTVMVPEFVVNEIQAIADSNDPSRKARGRRGLDVLENLRKICPALELVDKDYPELAAVDQKLVRLSRDLDGDLLTNDYNLQKIAQLHRIHVLNINELANALRPMVYIGEVLTLNIVREGKEAGQGVAYLDDGTMVVVDDARRLVGHEAVVLVSSILQTSSGRLVFARLRDEEEKKGLLRA